MNPLQDRIDIVDGRPIVKAIGQSVDDVVRRLEGGEPTVKVAASQPLDLIAALAFAALGDDSSEGPSLVQQPPARPRLDQALSTPELGRLFPNAPRVALLALAAGLLQIHDFWEPSHEAAQEADDLGERRFSAYWHAVAHRREPDPGNASYWFRRVGKHPLFSALAEAAAPLLLEYGDDRLTARLTGSGGWNPSAMIDLCATAKTGTAQAGLARRLQRLELGLLLAATAEAASD
ncbi:MAG: hypothetical protein P4L85_17260 [Paludisphaera borealis]|uniref:hypothetical protein n=1 Tax=Paludisphaera borealis TaxID=1387353 RepID=UPI002845E94B|nr:hypothetical protein [Paludisphaera borealis]MDR3621104.1 hypothetical protein [Paludisphaera borealis]